MSQQQRRIDEFIKTKREELENDLFAFAKYLNPTYIYGDIHEEIFSWMQGDISKNQLLLIPRGHLKSHCLAVWAAWWITKHPWTTMVYVSATAKLAELQLMSIKNMITSKRYKLLWPDMVAERENDREVWNKSEIMVDHPERKARNVRDYTVHATSISSNNTGLHCDVLLFDDIVVTDNAYTELGRETVVRGASSFIAIKNAEAIVKAVGTLYDQKDIYHQWIVGEEEIYDSETGDFVCMEKIWSVKSHVVEDSPNRTGDGVFLWPRQMHPETGQWEGYDIQVLARKRGEYFSSFSYAEYYSQYYNDTNPDNSRRVDNSNFQYLDRRYLTVTDGKVYFKDKQLKTFAGMDVAWTERRGSDYTAIAVIGLDSEGFTYILDLVRFKTSHFEKYYQEVINLHRKWHFRKIRVETNAGGKFVEQELKRIIRLNGDSLAVEGKPTTSREGNKKERAAAIIEPRYGNQSVYHFSGGLTNVYEEELILERPPHDDLLDAVVTAVSIAEPPAKSTVNKFYLDLDQKVISDSRFGGRRLR